MKRYYSAIGLGLIFFATSVLSCDDLKGLVDNKDEQHLVCDKKNNVLYGYSTKYKEPLWGAYKVSSKPIERKVVNRGVYPAISDLKPREQMNISILAKKGMDKAYMIAPYLIVNRSGSQEAAFGVQNILSVDTALWREYLKPALFEMDKLEIDMNDKLGGVLAIYGVVTGKAEGDADTLTNPKYLYRAYVQSEYKLSIAFLIPIKKGMSSEPEQYIVPIDCIERVAGVNIFANIEKSEQADIENKAAWNASIWSRKDGNKEVPQCVI